MSWMTARSVCGVRSVRQHILALIWLAAAVISGLPGNLEMTGLYVLMGAAFGYSAWASWKKAKNDKRGN